MVSKKLGQQIYHQLFELYPTTTVILARYLMNYKSLANIKTLQRRVSLPLINIRPCLQQFQKLGLLHLGAPILIDKIGMGRFANNLRKQQSSDDSDTSLIQRGWHAVQRQVDNPKIDGVYYNMPARFKNKTDEILDIFEMIRTPQLYIKTLIYLTKRSTLTHYDLLLQLGANNDADKILKILRQVNIIKKVGSQLHVNHYRLHITIHWFIAEGQKDNGRILQYNLRSIIAQQLFNFN